MSERIHWQRLEAQIVIVWLLAGVAWLLDGALSNGLRPEPQVLGCGKAQHNLAGCSENQEQAQQATTQY